jgi:DNA polymerase-1
MGTLLCVDGTNLLHRSFHALESTQMRDGDGRAIWAAHGLVRTVARYIDDMAPSSLVVAFDAPGGCPWRKELAPTYKEGRATQSPELGEQLAWVEDFLVACGVAAISVDDWEADDILATAATMATESGARCVVASSDKDAHQLVGEGVQVYKLEGLMVDDDYLEAKYHLRGSRWVEYAALLGEGADNLAGVNGIGPKRASALLGAFSDVELAIGDIPKVRELFGNTVANSLEAGVSAFRRNRQVGTLRRDLDIDLSAVRTKNIDPEVVREKGIEFSLTGAATRLAGSLGRLRRS